MIGVFCCCVELQGNIYTSREKTLWHDEKPTAPVKRRASPGPGAGVTVFVIHERGRAPKKAL